MTTDEAMVLLKYSPNTLRPSRINTMLSEQHFVGVIRKAIEGHTGNLDPMLEMRVMQAVQGRKRPLGVWKAS